MAISKRLRFEILRRDGHACRYCGARAPEVKLTVDHVIPKALGGTDDPANLAASCGPCNGGKSSGAPDAPLVAEVNQDAMRWQMAWAAAVAEAKRNGEQRAKDVAKVKRNYATAYRGRHGEAPVLPDGWQSSVGRWLDLGLTVQLIDEAISAAVGRERIRREDRWAYFAGCCWGTLRKLADRATDLAEAGPDESDHDGESTIRERIAAVFSGGWGDGLPLPTTDDWRTLDAHILAADAAGYREDILAQVARRAGRERNPCLVYFLPTVDDVFDMADRGPAGSAFKRLGISPEHAPNRLTRAANAVALAARLVWCGAWEDAHEEAVDLRLAREVHSSAWDLYPYEADAQEIIRAAGWAGAEGSADLKYALGQIKVDDMADAAVAAWEHAFQETSLARSRADDYLAVREACAAIAAKEPSVFEVTVAATFAGLHGTTSLHYGLTDDQVKGSGVAVHLQLVEDFWALIWRRTHADWPEQCLRAALRANVKSVAADGGYAYADLYAAAATAALAESVDLRPGLPKWVSAISAAQLLGTRAE